MPGAQAKLVDEQLQRLFQQVQRGKFAQQFSFKSSKYEGAVRHGNIIQGEQVSVTPAARFFGLPGSGLEPTMKLVFSNDKKMTGMVFKTEQETMLIVFTDPQAKLPQARYINTMTYRLEGTNPVRIPKTRLTRYRLNTPREEGLFRLTPAR